MEAATAIYGTEGFTDELFEAIKAANLDAVRIAYDADEAGERAATRDAERLQGIDVSCYRIKFPIGEDANSFAMSSGAEALKKAVRSAEWLGAGTPPVPARAPSSLAAELAADAGEAAKKKKPRRIGTASTELIAVGDQHELTAWRAPLPRRRPLQKRRPRIAQE